MSSPSWPSEAPPRAAILGAGAIGGWLAAALAEAGWHIEIFARGAALAALRRAGLTLLHGDGGRSVAVRATDDPREIAAPDLLVLGLKGHDLAAATATIAALRGPHTLVLSAQNGVPWWFLDGFGGPAAGRTLESVDPAGTLAALLPAGRVLAAVVHATARIEAPGVVRLIGQDRLLLGDPTGALAAPLARLVADCRTGGIAAQNADDIRGEIWSKLWGNATMNPLSALALADTAALLDDPGVAGLIAAMMAEFAAVGAAIGLPLRQTAAERIAVTRRLGPIRTSMLADRLAGKRLERGPILGAPIELGAIAGVPTPHLAGIDGLLRLLEASPVR